MPRPLSRLLMSLPVGALLLGLGTLGCSSGSPGVTVIARPAWIDGLAATPDAKYLVFAQDRVITVWDVAAKAPKARFPGRKGVVICLAVRPDGRRVAVSAWDEPVKLFDLDGKEVASCEEVSGPTKALAFSPDGKVLAASIAEVNPRMAASEIKLWDGETAKPLGDLPPNKVPAHCLAFSPDGKALFVGATDGKVRVHDMPSRSERLHFDGKSDLISALAVAPDSTLLALSGLKVTGARLFDPSGKEKATLSCAEPQLRDLAFSPSGKALAAARDDGSATVWDVAGGKELASLKGHQGQVRCVAWMGDETLATGGMDGLVKLWDLKTKAERETITPAQPGAP